jgi:predicted nucleic acid-binding protein
LRKTKGFASRREEGVVLTAYDAAYLELAIRRGLPPATLDDRLRSAAQAAGVFVC